MHALVVALLALAAAGRAAAHAPAPDFVSVVRGVVPPAPGLQVRMLGSDSRLEIRDPGHTVVVAGYDGEAFARLLPDGTAQVNERSPAAYLNRDRSGTTPVPPAADPSAPASWTVVSRTGALAWHDHRAHWMGRGIPAQVTRLSARTRIFDYRVPILVDGHAAAIVGTLYWAGRPPGPSIAAAAAVVLGPIAVAIPVLLWMLGRARGGGRWRRLPAGGRGGRGGRGRRGRRP